MSLRNSAAAMKNWFEATPVENGPPWLLWYNDMLSDAERISALERELLEVTLERDVLVGTITPAEYAEATAQESGG